MVTDVVVLLDFISRRDAEDCVAARRELKAFHFNGILKSKCLAAQKKFSCVFVLFVVSTTPRTTPRLRSQENHTTCAPCFAEGMSESDNQVSLRERD